MKARIQRLKQKHEQGTKSFVAEINALYEAIYKDDDILQTETNQILKDEKLTSIFVKGLQPQIRQILFERFNPDGSNKEPCEKGIEAEKFLIARNMNEVGSINSIVPEPTKKIVERIQ